MLIGVRDILLIGVGDSIADRSEGYIADRSVVRDNILLIIFLK